MGFYVGPLWFAHTNPTCPPIPANLFKSPKKYMWHASRFALRIFYLPTKFDYYLRTHSQLYVERKNLGL